MPPITVPSDTPMKAEKSVVQTKFKTAKGTELPFLMMERKSLDKKTGVWSTKVTPYLQVAHRLVWFREERPAWGIETDFLTMENSVNQAICVAKIKDETGRIIAMATKQETKADFSDFIEKAETGSIGRALALCGFGTQYAPELDEGDRLADSPIQPAKAAKPETLKENLGIETPEAEVKVVSENNPIDDDMISDLSKRIEKSNKRSIIALKARVQATAKLTPEQKEILGEKIVERENELAE